MVLQFHGKPLQKKRGTAAWKVSTIVIFTRDKSEKDKPTYMSKVLGEGLQPPSSLDF